MKVLPKAKKHTDKEDDLTPMQRLSKRLALALSFVSVFIFFIKIVFL